MHTFSAGGHLSPSDAVRPRAEHRGEEMIATLTVLSVILVSFVVGCLTSSVDTEQKLPHRLY
jgi:hypothetical protein